MQGKERKRKRRKRTDRSVLFHMVTQYLLTPFHLVGLLRLDMLVLLLTILSVSIHYGQSAIEATADVRLDNTNASIGILTFYQEDANSDVKITGTLNSLAADSNLVCNFFF